MKELTDGQIAKQAHRLLAELLRRDRLRLRTDAGVVLSRENGKPTLVVAAQHLITFLVAIARGVRQPSTRRRITCLTSSKFLTF